MIADETIEQVKRSARIVAIIGERLRLERRGRSHVGLCPFHKEKTPSFHVNDERGFYHCFGCGAGGDTIKFLREVDGLSFEEAVRAIAEHEGIEVVETGSADDRRQRAEERRRRDELYEAGDAAAAFFESMLKTHALGHHAREELARRGLETSANEAGSGAVSDALSAFRVGYAPYGWDELARHLRERRIDLLTAERVGLIAPRKTGSGHYDRFRHRLMFAVLDLDGRVVAFSGRALTAPSSDELTRLGLSPPAPGEEVAKYINSPESPVYRKRETVFGLRQARQAIRSTDRIVLVEGNFDVVSLHARGLCHVVAPLGTAFTLEQAKLLKRFSANVTFAFDGDEAGRRAVRGARDACNEAGLTVSVARLPDNTDPDQLAREQGIEAVQRYVHGARSLLEYLITATLDRFASDDARGRAAKVREVAALIGSEDDPTVRAMAERHADAIAERLGIADARTFRALSSTVHQAVANAEARTRSAGSSAAAAPPERARSRDRRDEIGLLIFGALLDFPALLDEPSTLEAMDLAQGDLAVAFAALRQGGAPTIGENPEQWLAKLPASIHSFAAARLVAPRHERADDARSELIRNVEKLKRLELSRQKTEVLDELERLQASGDFDRELMLLREQERRARERHGL